MPAPNGAGIADVGGERGIRTPGGLTLNGFQDRRIRPLCHLSERACKSTFFFNSAITELPLFWFRC